MKLLKIDEQGFYVESVIFDKIPTIIEIQIIDGQEVEVEVNNPNYITKGWQGKSLYKPKWNFILDDWEEGLTQNEIDDIKNMGIPLTQDDIILLSIAENYERQQADTNMILLALAELNEIQGGTV